MQSQIQTIVEKYGHDASRLMDIFLDLTEELGCVGQDELKQVANLLGISTVEAEQTLSFYHFFSQ